MFKSQENGNIILFIWQLYMQLLPSSVTQVAVGLYQAKTSTLLLLDATGTIIWHSVIMEGSSEPVEATPVPPGREPHVCSGASCYVILRC